MEIVGWISAILLIACGIPQAVRCVKKGSAEGLSSLFIWMWFIGEVFGLFYVIDQGSLPMIANYTFNGIVCMVLLYYVVRRDFGEGK